MILKPARMRSISPGELRVHGLIDGLVSGAHDLREAEVADPSDEQAGDGGLEELRPAGQRFQARAEVADRFCEEKGSKAAEDTEDGVGEQLAGVAKVTGGMRNIGSAPQKAAGDDDARDRGENDGAEDAGAPLANDLFDDEEDGGDGSVEGRGQSRGGADGSESGAAFRSTDEAAAES